MGPDGWSPTLLRLGVWLGAKLSFAEAADFLTQCTGTRLSAATVRRATIASGEAVRQLAEQRIATLEAGTEVVPSVPTELLQVSVDGSMLPMVGGDWREARLAAIGVVRPDATDPSTVRTTHLSYTAALCSAEAFGREALPEVVRRGLDQAPRVVAVSDGAPWIQTWLDYHCPRAVRILDFPHAVSYLAAAAQATFGPGTGQTSEWMSQTQHELRHGDPDQVLAVLAALPQSEERDTALRYLRERRPMIDYAAFREAGYPIGSGCVESGHKTVLQARLKRGGMHWHPDVLPAMIALRVTLANERWDEVWPGLGLQRRQAQHARSAARRQQRRPPPRPVLVPAPRPSSSPAPGRPKLVQQGRPTSQHPWRRAFIRRSPGSDTKM